MTEVRAVRAGWLAAGTLGIVVSSCGAGPALVAGHGRSLRAGERATAGPTGLRVARVLSRGVLAYDVAVDGAGTRAVSIELDTEFWLVSRAIDTGREAWRVRLGDSTYDAVDVDMDAAGTTVAVAALDARVRVFDGATGAQRFDWRQGDAATAVAVSPDGQWIATGTATGVMCLRRANDGALLQCVAAHDGRIAALVFAADGARLASSSWESGSAVWSVPSLAQVAHGGGEDHLPITGDVALSPDGRMAVVLGDERPRRTPEIEGDEEHGHFAGHAEVRVSPNTHIGGGDEGFIHAIAWTPDGHRLLTGGTDRALRLWDTDHPGPELARLGGFTHMIRAIAVTADGRHAVVASWAGKDRDGPSVTVLDLLYSP